MLPGGSKFAGASVDEKQIKRTEAIITSMTNDEQEEPSIINGSRRSVLPQAAEPACRK